MKYFYFIYFLVGYVAAEELINLQELTPHCECNDIIDLIECKIADNTKDLLSLQKKYAKVATRAELLLRQLNDNFENMADIKIQLIDVENQQFTVINVVEQHNKTITTIDAEVDEILDDLNQTDVTLNNNICTVEDLIKRLISVSICDCEDVRCRGVETTTPA